jgi:hypothetical protein
MQANYRGSAEIQLREKASLPSSNVCTLLRESASQVKLCISCPSLQTHKIAGMSIAEKTEQLHKNQTKLL